MKNNLNALVIDDDPQVGSLVSEVLRTDGWNVHEARSAGEAFEQLEKESWLLVFCDVVLGGTDGYAVLRRFSEEQPKARFVLMTGHGSAAGALDATAIGAYDYLVKPFTIDDILTISRTVREQRRSRSTSERAPQSQVSKGYESDIPLIGKSQKFVECLKLVGRVAGTNLPVLITGESGTGKEVAAQAIHQRSKRSSGAFVTLNCGAVPVELIESELFGHAKGSFTGAARERTGLWEEADGGTIFLDEITETSSLFQIKLLRALQQGEIRRVGSNTTQKVDVRVIAATNRDIAEEVKSGRFRQDLMYRLNAVTIHLPPLRERLDDIPLLAEHFAASFGPRENTAVRFSNEALEILRNYNWQGNVRELENAVLHAVSLSDDIVYPEHIPSNILTSSKRSTATPDADGVRSADSGGTRETDRKDWVTLAEMEQKYVNQVLDFTGGNKQAAARILSIDRKTLSRIIGRNESGK